MANSSKFSHDDYTVSWICALPLEMAAAKRSCQMNHNNYTLCRRAGHNVVVACLPSGVYRTTPAAMVLLTQMLPTFPRLRFGLMAGIGGGVSREDTDVRLGDVVVSLPSEISGGFSRLDRDWLFEPTYIHENGPGCSQCDQTRLVKRVPRENQDPYPHDGLIASGNQAIKDAAKRDALAQEVDILCFEMEAAGLMDQFPCLVIRGICDYCNSHKIKEGQGYAALAAAAYAKALLELIPKHDRQPEL
ncbi:nucleoside phosphorylase domain-containing protein [Aspergillus recurvatus]